MTSKTAKLITAACSDVMRSVGFVISVMAERSSAETVQLLSEEIATSERVCFRENMTNEEVVGLLAQPGQKILLVDFNDPNFTPSKKAVFLQVLIDGRVGDTEYTINPRNLIVIVQTNYKGMRLPSPLLNKTCVLPF